MPRGVATPGESRRHEAFLARQAQRATAREQRQQAAADRKSERAMRIATGRRGR